MSFRKQISLVFCVFLAACGGKDGSTDDTGGLPGELLGILVSPDNVILPLGGEAQLVATGLFDDRTSMDVTHLASWSSSKFAFVGVSNDLDEEGVVSGLKVGEALIEASLNGVTSVPVGITVTDAALMGVAVEPSSVSLERGDTLQLRASAVYSDGGRGDATTQVRWISNDGSVAQIESSGVLTASGAGSTQIHAELEGLSSPDVSVSVLTSAQADLTISGLELEAGDEEVTVTVEVKNRGSAGASSFWVDLFLDPSTTPQVGDLGNTFKSVEYCGPDETVTVSFSVAAGEGSHTIWVIADTDGFVEESSTSNNSANGSVSIGGSSTTGPNLTITYFSFIADTDSIYYAIDVYNAGGEDVGQFFLDLFVDEIYAPEVGQDGDEWTLVSSLGAGETEFADFIVEQTCSFCWSWVLVDSYDYIEETDETDNVEGPLTVDTD